MMKRLFWGAIAIAFLAGNALGLSINGVTEPIGWFLLGLSFACIVIIGVANVLLWGLEHTGFIERDERVEDRSDARPR